MIRIRRKPFFFFNKPCKNLTLPPTEDLSLRLYISILHVPVDVSWTYHYGIEEQCLFILFTLHEKCWSRVWICTELQSPENLLWGSKPYSSPVILVFLKLFLNNIVRQDSRLEGTLIWFRVIQSDYSHCQVRPQFCTLLCLTVMILWHLMQLLYTHLLLSCKCSLIKRQLTAQRTSFLPRLICGYSASLTVLSQRVPHCSCIWERGLTV